MATWPLVLPLPTPHLLLLPDQPSASECVLLSPHVGLLDLSSLPPSPSILLPSSLCNPLFSSLLPHIPTLSSLSSLFPSPVWCLVWEKWTCVLHAASPVPTHTQLHPLLLLHPLISHPPPLPLFPTVPTCSLMSEIQKNMNTVTL